MYKHINGGSNIMGRLRRRPCKLAGDHISHIVKVTTLPSFNKSLCDIRPAEGSRGWSNTKTIGGLIAVSCENCLRNYLPFRKEYKPAPLKEQENQE